jgi:hypothetical protein
MQCRLVVAACVATMIGGAALVPSSASAAANLSPGGALQATVDREAGAPIEFVHQRSYRHCHRDGRRRYCHGPHRRDRVVRRCTWREGRFVWTRNGLRWRPPTRVCRTIYR